jgi:hypothetical protein
LIVDFVSSSRTRSRPALHNRGWQFDTAIANSSIPTPPRKGNQIFIQPPICIIQPSFRLKLSRRREYVRILQYQHHRHTNTRPFRNPPIPVLEICFRGNSRKTKTNTIRKPLSLFYHRHQKREFFQTARGRENHLISQSRARFLA